MHLPRPLLEPSNVVMEGSMSEVEVLVSRLARVQIRLHLDVSDLDLNSAEGFGSCQAIDLVNCVTSTETFSESGPPWVFVVFEVKPLFGRGPEAELVREVHIGFVSDRLAVQVLV